MKITSIIVDDEPLARDVLKKYIKDCPVLDLVGTCSNAFEAIQILKEKDIRIIFLDINLPKLSGLSLVRTMDHPPQVVFTTAYPEFAVEGFEVDATDYLVKPFSFERFMKAVNKALAREKKIKTGSDNIQSDSLKKFMVKADGKLYQLDYEDILYFEAFGDYVRVYTEQKNIVTHDTMRKVEEHLPAHMFLRIHRSYIISLNKIEYIEGNRVKIGKEYIPVGQSYRANLEAYLGTRGNGEI